MISLLLIGAGAIVVLLALTLVLKLQPFLALLLVSILVALIAGVPVANLAKTIEDGLGGSLGHIALIIALGAMIGRIIEVSGGAEAFAQAMIQRFGVRHTPLALTVAGFFIGIPVFFEVGVVMLMPLAHGIARKAGRSVVVLALPMCVALLVVHATLPPHPGAVAVAGLFGGDIGRILAFGLPIAAMTALFTSLVSGLLTRGFAGTGAADETDNAAVTDAKAELAAVGLAGAPPAVGLIIALILLPIVLILGSTVAGLMLPEGTARTVLGFFGIPFVALLIDVLVCAYVLGVRRGWRLDQVADVLSSAIPGVALVILITGGGAIFAKVLVVTGIGGVIAGLMQSTGLPVLLLGFLLAMLIRAMQGPTTIALMTAGGLLGPMAAQAHLSPNHLALLCLAMGAGGLGVSHVNDAGFWVVTRFLGLSVRDGLRTWTVLTTAGALCAFGLIYLIWPYF